MRSGSFLGKKWRQAGISAVGEPGGISAGRLAWVVSDFRGRRLAAARAARIPANAGENAGDGGTIDGGVWGGWTGYRPRIESGAGSAPG
jgi:hypothetical protein